ncbi:MAG: hypothetical protein ACRDBY_08615 [Cetobacterium sp.]
MRTSIYKISDYLYDEKKDYLFVKKSYKSTYKRLKQGDISLKDLNLYFKIIDNIEAESNSNDIIMCCNEAIRCGACKGDVLRFSLNGIDSYYFLGDNKPEYLFESNIENCI